MTARAPNDLCRAFAKHLKERGWCKRSDAKSQQIRAYNRFDGSLEPKERVGELLSEWLMANKHELDDDDATWKRLYNYGWRSLVTTSGDVFMPMQPTIYTHPESKNCYVNTYRQHEPKTDRTDDIQDFLELLGRLLPDADDYAHVVPWMADTFQNPGRRPTWHVMCPSSDTGTGKGFLVEQILNPLLKHTEVARSYNRLTGQFSTMLDGSLLILLDDPTVGRAGTMTELKSILSEPRLLVEQKGLAAGMRPTFTRIVLFSNESNPVGGHSENERRWWVTMPIKHRHDADETAAFLKRLATRIKHDPQYLDRIYNWFLAYDLGAFDPYRVKQSVTLRDMIGASKDPLEDFYSGFLADNKVFRQVDLVNAIKEAGYVRPSDPAIKATLTALGWEKRPFFVGGKRSPYYCPKGTTQAQVEAHLAAQAFDTGPMQQQCDSGATLMQ